MSLFSEAPGDLVFQAKNLPAPRGGAASETSLYHDAFIDPWNFWFSYKSGFQ